MAFELLEKKWGINGLPNDEVSVSKSSIAFGDNFKKIFESPIPFSTSNYEMIVENNYVNDQDGEPIEILTLEWINETKTAEIEYAEFSDEGNNTKTIVIDE